MRPRRLVLVLSLLLAATLPPTVAIPASASTTVEPWAACSKRLNGIRVPITATQHTVTVVNQTSKTHARLSFYRRVDGACSFSREFRTRSARLGYGGTVAGTKRKQGSGTTPRGTYTMTEAFGNGSAPTTAMPFHEVVSGDYWVQDNKSDYYNTLRNKADGGFRWQLPASSANSSEKLRHYRSQYRYAVVINFNRAPDSTVRHRGSGIFLHVKGSGATAGCVAVTRHQMEVVLSWLQPGDTITIAR
jgi:L,D-peptidoglycan transpeptidase YkuD (ErfK/YbiS/YcfS/YnhG family)